ncbi:MAG TPA: MlaD family protein [Kofleriaceae bacterium]|nr:MlaD family protein [Kofleriaceae bacterium]
MTATKAQKIRVGIFTAVSIALLAVVLIVFGGLRFWKKHDSYRIQFTGSVYGLEKGAPVHLNGIRVGVVDDIGLAADDLKKVEVKITVDRGTQIHTDTRAVMQYAGITGLKVIDLRDGTHATPLLPAGSLIPEGETTLDRFERQAKQIVDQSTEVMQRANKVMDNLVAITDPTEYRELVHSAKLTAANLSDTSAQLKSMVGENRVALRQSIEAVRDTARSASQVMDGQVTQLLANAGDFVSELKSFVRDNQGTLRAAMFDLRQASRNFKDLSREVRQRPSRLIYSSPPSERKLP